MLNHILPSQCREVERGLSAHRGWSASRSPSHRSESQLADRLLHELATDILSKYIRWVLCTQDLDKVEFAAANLVLDPEELRLEMTHLPRAKPLSHPFCGVRVCADLHGHWPAHLCEYVLDVHRLSL